MDTMFVDTHCHVNFKRFNKTINQVILESKNKSVGVFIVPGTDIPSSQKAVELATENDTIYSAVGIHPHHTAGSLKLKAESSNIDQLKVDMRELEKLIVHPKVVAVGEVGLDRHVYEDTKYADYQINDAFMEVQKGYFIAQMCLAKQYKKALIIHNRETKNNILAILEQEWGVDMCFHTVFHCCEPDDELLAYAKTRDIFIGIDGDVTYGGEKAEFAKNVPLEMLVLETDSPFLLPEPLRTKKLYPNTPANIPLIAACIANIKGISVERVARVTTENAKKLFNI